MSKLRRNFQHICRKSRNIYGKIEYGYMWWHIACAMMTEQTVRMRMRSERVHV